MRLVSNDWYKNFTNTIQQSPIPMDKPNETDKAKRLYHKLIPHLSLDVNERIVYNDGTKGSSLAHLIEYVTSPKSKSIERPFDSDTFVELISGLKIPLPELDLRFQGLFNIDTQKNINTKSQTSREPRWKPY